MMRARESEIVPRGAPSGVPSLRISRGRAPRASAPEGVVIPRVEAYACFTPDPVRLAAFRELCGQGEGDFVPPTWPHVVATPLHLYLVSAPDSPMPALDVAHAREVIVQCRPIAADAELHVRCRIDGGRPGPRGVAFDLVTEVATARGGPVVWRSTTTALCRPTAAERALRSGGGFAPVDGERWSVSEETSRRYAWVSRSVDALHLQATTSRRFGVRRPVVQGMWLVARSLAALGRAAAPLRVDVRFGAPFFVPGEAVFVSRPGDAGQRWFAVQPAWGGRAYLEGELTRL